MLHAAPAFFPVYESVEYTGSTSNWTDVPVKVAKLLSLQYENPSTVKCRHVRRAQFPGDTEQLQRLHQQCSEHRLAGCILRSSDYWNNYLSQEILQNPLYVLANGCDDDDEGDIIVVAWLSIGFDATLHTVQMRDFGMDESHQEVTTAFGQLLQRALQKLPADNRPFNTTLQLPSFLAIQLQDLQTNDTDASPAPKTAHIDWSKAVARSDHGWMYLALTKKFDLASMLGSENSPPQQKQQHFIWPSDSF